jgi:hypothetical protein
VLALFLGIAPAAFGVAPLAAAAERIADAPIPGAAEPLAGAVPSALGDARRALAGGAAALVPQGPSVASFAPVSDRVPGGAPVLGAAGGAFLAAGLMLARRFARGAGGA